MMQIIIKTMFDFFTLKIFDKLREDVYKLLSFVVHCARIRTSNAPNPRPSCNMAFGKSPIPVVSVVKYPAIMINELAIK